MNTSETYITSEAYLQKIFSNVAVGIAIFQGTDFIIEVANPGVCAIWGRTQADVLGKPLFVALPEAAGQGFEELLADVMRTKQPFTGRELPATINRNGQLTTVYFDFVYEPLLDDDGQVNRILVTASDATERRQIRQQLEASEANLQTLFEQAPVAIAILRGPDLTYELANSQYVELVNRSTRNDLIGKPLLEALPELINQGIDILLYTVIQTGETYTARERSIEMLRNGQLETGYYNFVYEPLRNTEGVAEGIFVVATSVTEQVLAQRQANHLLVQERELNDLKSNFLTLASHEFRTPMSMILSSASLIGRYNGVDDTVRRERHVQRIKSSVHSLIGILSDFLSLSQMDEETLHGRPNPLDLASFCQEVVDDLQGLIKPDQHIVYRHLAGESVVSLDGQMLKNILINLLVNASKYSSEGKEIELTTTVQNEQLLFTVKDEGIGIPDVDKDKLFINFFRARNATHMQGTGLGLYIVKRYVDLLGGSITFTSQLNAGTIFTIQLPISTIPT
jgi:PAS domain S-box-containing protein